MGQTLEQKILEAEKLLEASNNIAGDSCACLTNVLEAHGYASVKVLRITGQADEPETYHVRPHNIARKDVICCADDYSGLYIRPDGLLEIIRDVRSSNK